MSVWSFHYVTVYMYPCMLSKVPRNLNVSSEMLDSILTRFSLVKFICYDHNNDLSNDHKIHLFKTCWQNFALSMLWCNIKGSCIFIVIHISEEWYWLKIWRIHSWHAIIVASSDLMLRARQIILRACILEPSKISFSLYISPFKSPFLPYIFVRQRCC